MTTRAGFTGLLTGLVVTISLAYPLASAWPPDSAPWSWVALAATLTVGGGFLAGRWSGSPLPIRCAALGGLAGGLTGSLVFCWLGAAAAGLTGAAIPAASQPAQVEIITAIVCQTQLTFLACFGAGTGLGLLGGWLARPRRGNPAEIFDKSAPQMALNAAITAVPATILTTGLAAAIFSSLAELAGGQANSILDLPLAVSLLLVLISHLALTLVIPHETRQAEHRCGLDEVKMAAYVGIGAAPTLAASLLWAGSELFSKPLVMTAMLASAGLSLKAWQTLTSLILPRRATFPPPPDERSRTEAQLFGTIAASRGPRLVVLCIGCGLVMVLPLQVVVVAGLVNLNCLLSNPVLAQSAPAEVARKLFLTQALVSSGLLIASAAALIILYLFYLNLGRWFSRQSSLRH